MTEQIAERTLKLRQRSEAQQRLGCRIAGSPVTIENDSAESSGRCRRRDTVAAGSALVELGYQALDRIAYTLSADMVRWEPILDTLGLEATN